MKKPILLPVVTIFVAAAILLGLSLGLNGIAAANAQEAHLQIMRTVLPDSVDFTLEPYAGNDANIRSVHKAENGFVVEAVTYGYAGEVTMYIGVNNDGYVTGLVVWDAHETPGLGGNALADHVFLSQFLNKTGEFTIGTSGADAFSGATGEVSEDAASVDGITGATVTSKAVARCVTSAVAYVTGADTTSSATSWGG